MHPASQMECHFDRCNNCGLEFLNPKVAESDLSQFYTHSYIPYCIEEGWGKYASFVKRDQRNTNV